MKKYLLPLFVLGISLFYSCSKEEISNENNSSSDAAKVKMEFKSGIDPFSRTVLVAGNKVNWEENDAISLFDQNSNNKFTTSEGGESVMFTGSAQDNQNTYYALYPYDADATISGDGITTTLPAKQTARAGSFANNLNPSVAKSGSDKTLIFKNACALVKFTLQYSESNKITKVMFRGNSGEALAGKLLVQVNDATPLTAVESDFSTEVILSDDQGFENQKDYYFVVAPAELKNGITLVLYDANGMEWKRSSNNPVTLKSGHILNLDKIEPGEFKKVIRISTAEQLIAWAESEDRLTTDVILDADIEMKDMKWTPVGSSMDIGKGYSGNFDGNGNAIKNLSLSGTGNIGFFGGLAIGANVHDVVFTDATITGDASSSVGVVAGTSLGIIDNCKVSNSTVSGSNYAGAITGNNSVQVNNCSVQDVTINGKYAGGVAGVNYGKIEYCKASGSKTKITSTGLSAGGIVGSNSEEGGTKTSGRVLKCAAYGITISGNRAGGIAGENGFGTVAQCVVDKCTVIHNSTGSSANLGGVVGYNARGEVVASYSVNSIVGADNLISEAIGGIVGYNMNSASSPAYIYGCYSTHVSLLGNAGSNIGAIAGYNNGHVTSCYAVLPDGVTGITLIGNEASTGIIDHCVEVGGNNYNYLEEADNLKVTDGTIWIAAEIWEITEDSFPSVNANYIGEGIPSN